MSAPAAPGDPAFFPAEAPPPSLLAELRRLYRYRDLLALMTWRNVTIKYKQSILGVLWAIFMPLIIIAAGMIVKSAFAILSGKPVDLAQLGSVAVRSLPWSFFVSSLRLATTSLTGNANLVTKISFPKEIFPLAIVLAQLLDLAIATAFIALILSLSGIGVSAQLVWVPLFLVLLVALVLGLAILFAAGNLFFRDVKYVTEVVLTFGIFFSPVFYPASLFREWEPLILLNPIAPILEGLDAVIVRHHPPDPAWTLYSAAVGLGLLFFAFRFFKRVEPAFAESI